MTAKGNSNGRDRGKHAEQVACHYLQRQGLTLVERNYACTRGEIDLVMRQADVTVFVEVRFRRNIRYGSGAESVDWRKQDKLRATAAHYLQQHPKAAKGACRFDVVSLTANGSAETEPHDIDWITDAFQA